MKSLFTLLPWRFRGLDGVAAFADDGGDVGPESRLDLGQDGLAALIFGRVV